MWGESIACSEWCFQRTGRGERGGGASRAGGRRGNRRAGEAHALESEPVRTGQPAALEGVAAGSHRPPHSRRARRGPV